MAHVLLPLPDRDFDPTEAAVSWRILTGAGHRVTFATQSGEQAAADALMLTGHGLDPWGFLPGLRRLALVGRILRARKDARADYGAMLEDEEFKAPIAWSAIDPAAYDALLLPGGHRARGMRTYLESATLQAVTARFFDDGKPVAAICHGVLLAARSVSPRTGRSVLHGRRTTALTWSLEDQAWRVARRTRFWDSAYYRTYSEAPGDPAGYMSVQAEVIRALADPSDFQEVSRSEAGWRRKSSGLARDTVSDRTPAFVVTDGAYVSARWPGDAHAFAATFAALLDTKRAS